MGEKIFWVSLRIFHGLLFFWAFIDKLYGLGFATTPAKSWLNGNSPTLGFLKFGAHGPFKAFYGSIAGLPLVDWLFMMGLLGIGLALILGVAVKPAGVAGAAMTILMYTALIPPENHPFLDEHLLEALTFIGLATTSSHPGSYLGLGKWWRNTKLVQKCPCLE